MLQILFSQNSALIYHIRGNKDFRTTKIKYVGVPKSQKIIKEKFQIKFTNPEQGKEVPC